MIEGGMLARDTLYNHEVLYHLCIFQIMGYSFYPKCVLDHNFPPPSLSLDEVSACGKTIPFNRKPLDFER